MGFVEDCSKVCCLFFSAVCCSVVNALEIGGGGNLLLELGTVGLD